MDVSGLQGRINGYIEPFLVIFCLCILIPSDVRLAFLPRFLQSTFQEVLVEENVGGIYMALGNAHFLVVYSGS